MLIWSLQQLGIPISYSIGTTLKLGQVANLILTVSISCMNAMSLTVISCILHHIWQLISTIDYDHPDTYPTQQIYLDAFRQFALIA